MSRDVVKELADSAREVWKRFEYELERADWSVIAWQALALGAPSRFKAIGEKMLGWWNSMAKGGWATIGPRELGPSWEKGTVVEGSHRTFLASIPAVSTGEIEIEKTDGAGGAEIVVVGTNRFGQEVQLQAAEFPVSKKTPTQTIPFGESGLALALRIKGKGQGLFDLDKFSYRIRLRTDPVKVETRMVKGFADLHVHQAAELAFGGAWLHGAHRGSAAKALCACGGLHASPVYPTSDEGQIRHGHGHPSYKNWPAYDDIAHQQCHENWLKEAHQNGLTLIVACAVNSEVLAAALQGLMDPILPGAQVVNSIRDMPSVKAQIAALTEMARERSWYEIAEHPWHARQIIHAGKLAVVLSVECSNLFPKDAGDYLEQLDELYRLKVRCLQPVHQINNRFAGAAPHRRLIGIASVAERLAKLDFIDALSFPAFGKGENKVGLRDDGRKLLKAMMQRGMLIDTTHMSARALRDTYELVSSDRWKYYPLLSTHSRFEDLLTQSERERQRELVTTADQAEWIRKTGGIIGLRTGEDEQSRDDDGPEIQVPGASDSFAQMVAYAWRTRVAIAFGSDFNGGISQVRPRRAFPRQPGVSSEYWEKGLAHIGLLPSLLAEVKALGTKGAEWLEKSTESFLQTWERCFERDGPAPARPISSTSVTATRATRAPTRRRITVQG